MKKIILLTALIFATVRFTFAQNTIAKLKFEEAEEAYTNNDFELTLSKLKDVETLLGATNPKILYLKILSQTKIIKKNPLNDYPIIENARKSCQKYLIDYENFPDIEDKYRDVYKTSEQLKMYPTSLQDFDEQKKQIEFAKVVKETDERNKNKKADEDFMGFAYFQGYKSGLTLEEAKLEYPAFFKSAKKSNFGINTYIYLNKEDMISQLIVKNGKLAGNSGKLIEPISDDANFTIGIKAISDIVNGLTTLFNLNPTETIHKYEQGGFIMNTNTFIWQKNGKSIVITYTQNGHSNGYWSTAIYHQFDKSYNE